MVESYQYDSDSTMRNKDTQRKYIRTKEIRERLVPDLNRINIIEN